MDEHGVRACVAVGGATLEGQRVVIDYYACFCAVAHTKASRDWSDEVVWARARGARIALGEACLRDIRFDLCGLHVERPSAGREVAACKARGARPMIIHVRPSYHQLRPYTCMVDTRVQREASFAKRLPYAKMPCQAAWHGVYARLVDQPPTGSIENTHTPDVRCVHVHQNDTFLLEFVGGSEGG